MESWQKELKEYLGGGTAEVYQGTYYGNAENPVWVKLPSTSDIPFTLRFAKVKELIATNILPEYSGVQYIGKLRDYPAWGGADLATMARFAREINSVKTMEETETTSGSGNPIISNADIIPLIITISIALALWILMK